MVIWFIWSDPAVFFTASLLFITKTPVSAPPASAEQHLFPQCCFPECHFPPCFLWRSVSWVEPSAVSRLQASQKTVCMSLCWTCKKKKWTQSGGGSVPTVVGIFRSLSVCLSSSPSASLSFPFISPSSLSLFLFLYACPHLHVSLCALLSSPLYSIYPIIDQQQHQQTVNVHCNKFF